MTESSLNQQMIDSVAAVNFINTGSSQNNAQAMLNAVMAETLGMAMHNAVMRQQSNSMVSSAATTAACARMLQSRWGGEPVKPHVPPVDPPVIPPLDGPPDSPPDGAVAVATAKAQADRAINTLGAEMKNGTAASSTLSGIAEAIKNFMPKPPEQPAPVAPVSGPPAASAAPAQPQADKTDPNPPSASETQ